MLMISRHWESGGFLHTERWASFYLLLCWEGVTLLVLSVNYYLCSMYKVQRYITD
ncbi:hypothetical protein B0T21DRAFT_363715 [Apiosordaria backusii]|uniref:Uncharacterized protein n=1 Tax=Apiosordaria backusii TaxID=314023 RepID=A0AA40BTD5_9PEZI|nr:hypothetical protein B0T21DRAFT_363715 [Apiosordaria backusii]